MTDAVQYHRRRRMWADVALLAIIDHAKRIHAAERGLTRASHDNGMRSATLHDRDGEIDAARRYFRSPDWREVASCAGIDPDPERALKACLLGPKALRRITTKNLSEAYRDDE